MLPFMFAANDMTDLRFRWIPFRRFCVLFYSRDPGPNLGRNQVRCSPISFSLRKFTNRFSHSFMMEARIPTRQWKGYDLATVVARDEKKTTRGEAEHLEKVDELEKPQNKRFMSLLAADSESS